MRLNRKFSLFTLEENYSKSLMSLQFTLMGKGVTYESKSRFRGDPYTIGDDICRHLKLKAGIKVMPPNRRFPQGVPIGMYYNLCGRREWLDTDIRIPANVCCQKRNPDNLYEKCPE